MPLVTLLLVALNIAAYALELQSGGMAVCEAYGLVPAHPSFETALSSLFLHDPSSLLHLGGNMAFLAVFGTIVEGALGHVRFGGLYVAAGLSGCALHVIVGPSSTDPLVGASGAIFGLLAVAAVLRRASSVSPWRSSA
jgi:membrane associated rhomboid family serine protease